jgi:hypothetical protein
MALQTQRESNLILFPWERSATTQIAKLMFVTMLGNLVFDDLHIRFVIIRIPEIPSQLT